MHVGVDVLTGRDLAAAEHCLRRQAATQRAVRRFCRAICWRAMAAMSVGQDKRRATGGKEAAR